MESEFRAKNPTPAPGYYQMLIDKLRQTREEHPMLDMAAGSLPIVGGFEAAADVSDSSLSPLQRSLSALQVLPGGKLLGKLGGKVSSSVGMVGAEDLAAWRKRQKEMADALREKVPVKELPPTKSTTPKEFVDAANNAYAEQLLREGDDPDLERIKLLMERVRKL